MSKLCECGCKREVKNRFISGHNNNRLGIHLSTKHKEKISSANKGKHNSISTEFKKNSGGFKGKHTLKTKLILKEKALSQFKNGMIKETKQKIRMSHIGKNHSIETKLKIGKTKIGNKYNLGKIHTEKTKQKQRVSAIKRIQGQFNKGLSSMPCIGKYEPGILDNLENSLGLKIKRQHKVCGYFLDGYIPSLNLAIEIDEKYHKSIKQLNKDEIRENNIKAELNCQFLRMEV